MLYNNKNAYLVSYKPIKCIQLLNKYYTQLLASFPKQPGKAVPEWQNHSG